MANPAPQTPTLKQLEYAVAVAELEHFGHAADQCNISQPTLSAQIKELESKIGVELFDRGPGGVKITPEAKPIIVQAREIIQQLQNLTAIVSDQQGEISGQLRLAFITTMSPYYVPNVVEQIQNMHPYAQVQIKEARTSEIETQLLSGELDLAVFASGIDNKEIQECEFYFEPFYLLADESTVDGIEAVTLEQLNNIPLVLLEDGHCLKDQAVNVCEIAGTKNYHQVQQVGLATLVSILEINSKATFLPYLAIDKEVQKGNNLRAVKMEDKTIGRQACLCWRKSSPRAKYYQQIGEALKQKYLKI